MAGAALGWRALEVTVLMACGTSYCFMSTDERKRGEVMIKTLAPGECCYTMALRTLRGEPGFCMIGVLRRLEVTPMTANACCRRADVLMGQRVRVATLAFQRDVPSHQGKARLLMLLKHIRYPPRLRCVAAEAVLSKLALVNICVT